MANPQKENGYTPIANEIIFALINSKLNGTQFKLLFFIIQKTYGWRKKEDSISLSQFKLFLNLDRCVISRELKKLNKRKFIITKRQQNQIIIYKFNKDYELWDNPKGLTNQSMGGLTNQSQGVDKLVTRGLTNQSHLLITKETLTKENIQKKTICDKSQIVDNSFKEEKKQKTLTNIQIIVNYYKVNYCGYAIEDKSWDKLNYKRFSRSAKLLLDFFSYNIEVTKKCIKEVIEITRDAKLNCTLETVVKQADRWKLLEKEEQEEKSCLTKKN